MKLQQPKVRIVTATEAKNNFGAIIKSAYALDEHLIVEKSGIPVVAIIPIADYQQLASARGNLENGSQDVVAAQRRAEARRDLSEFLKEIHAQMPAVEDDEDEVERFIQREVDAVRAQRARQRSKKARESKRIRTPRKKVKGAQK